MITGEIRELRETMPAWIDRRSSRVPADSSIRAISSDRETVGQIESQLCRRRRIRSSLRRAVFLSMAWSCLVIVLASAEYNEGAFGYGITTRAVVSTQAVGFVATHPIFVTTIRSKPEVVAILLVVPTLLLLAAGLLVPILAQRLKRFRRPMPILSDLRKKHHALCPDPVPMPAMVLILVTYILLALLKTVDRLR